MRSQKKIKLNLGCGGIYLKDFINTDITRNVKADKYFSLEEFPYPFKDNYADLILLDNVLEHLNDIVSTMREIHRILKPNGIVEIYLPYGKSDGALQDPTHRHYFTEKSMDYFTNRNMFNYYSDFRFTLLEHRLFSLNATTKSKLRSLIPFKKILSYFLFNIYDSLYFKLQAVKNHED